MERQNMMADVTKTVMKVRFKISEIENELSRLQGKLGNDAFRRAIEESVAPELRPLIRSSACPSISPLKTTGKRKRK
jgi:hypothetical protein